MADIVERRQADDESLPELEIKALSGLSVKLDSPNQPAGVWKNLQNCDLYIPGSIRRVNSPIAFGPGIPSSVSILNYVNYWAQPNSPNGPTNRLLGLGNDGKVYDLTTGAVWADFSFWLGTLITTIPYMEVFPNYFNPFTVRTWTAGATFNYGDAMLKYSAYDGNLYIYTPTTTLTTGTLEPIWQVPPTTTTDGTGTWKGEGMVKSQRFLENALLIQVPNKPMVFGIEYKLDPSSSDPTQVFTNLVGIPAPMVPPEVETVTITPNLNGYAPVAGRGFVYTLYDPHTFHESSPSPFAGPTIIEDNPNSNQRKTINGSLLKPLPTTETNKGVTQFQSYQSYYVAIPASVLQAALNQKYTAIYLYATRDGGTVFLRVPVILDNLGNQISNSDGSVNINMLLSLQTTNGWVDQFPLPTPMPEEPSCRLYEGSGQVNLAPDPENLGPASWTSANAGQIIVVPGDGQAPPNSNEPVSWAAGELPKIINADGTIPTLPKSTLRSNPIKITRGADYYFAAFCDSSRISAGIERWDVVSPDFGTLFRSMTFTPGTPLTGAGSGTIPPPVNGNVTGSAGWLSTIFNVPTSSQYQKVRLRMWANHTVFLNDDLSDDVVLWSTPMVFAGSAQPTIPINYPTPDDALVIPAPVALSQGPPPVGLNMALYGGCVFLVERSTFKIWFSNTGDFQSWGANNSLPLDDSSQVPVLELARIFDRLIVGKSTSISQITGNAGQFVEATVDPNHGMQSIRASIGFGNSYITLLNTGLMIIALGAFLQLGESTDTVSTGFRAEHVLGDPIKPLTDVIQPTTLFTNVVASPCSAIDTNQNFYLFAIEPHTGPPPLPPPLQNFTNYIFLADMAHRGPSAWSIMPLGNAVIIQMKEILRPDTNTKAVLYVSTASPNVPQVLFGGTQDGVLPAVAETWPLPDLQQVPVPIRDTIKIFHEVWVEGEDIANWTLQVSADYGATYTPAVPLQIRNKLGINARQLQLKFTHAVASSVAPMLSYIKITYSPRRQASGKNGF